MNTIQQQSMQCMTKGRIMKSNRMLALAVAVACLLPATGWSTVYLNNLDQPNDYDGHVTLSQWVASRFTTDNSAPAFRLDSLTLGKIYASTPGGNFVVSIYSCIGTAGNELPGSLIGNLSGSASPDTQSDYIYTATDITLQTNKSYWLVTRVTSGSADYRVGYRYSTANSAPGGWVYPSIHNYAWSYDQGNTWPTSGAMYPYCYEVEATGIPEPGAAFILGMTFLSAIGARRLT
ncbi:MAG: hypothetical protein NTV22_12020 [bacterium]|nr:hypothetical protein [bacterium]